MPRFNQKFESYITLKPFCLTSQSFKDNLIAYGSVEQLLIGDINDPENEIVVGSHEFQISATCISSTQEFVISGLLAKVNNLIIWDLKTKTMRSNLVGHNESVYCVDISADDLNAISGDFLGMIIYWNLTNSIKVFVF